MKVMKGKHLGKGLFQVHFLLGGWFTHSRWWHVVLIVPPSINPDYFDYFDYSDYYATLGLDSGSDSCCPHTDPVVVTD